MRFGLEEDIVESLVTVFEVNSKVDKVIVFGSRAKGNYRKDSDIDLAVKGIELTAKDILDLHVKLSELNLPYEIDLLNYSSIKEPELTEHIDRVGIEFYIRWKTIPLSKTTKFIVDNRGKTVPTIPNEGIPLIATNCINNSNLYPVYENIRYISKETYDNWFRSHPESGDIILTLKGSQNGAVCLVPDPFDFAIAQDMVALRADEKVIYPLFLFAALRSEDAQYQIRNLDVSGVIPHLKKSDFDKLLLPYPDMRTQKSIGDIYFNLSKKIDLLSRENKTLEQLAETLFRQWFVEEAEESWEEITLSEIATHSKESVNPSKYPNKIFRHYSLPAFDEGKEPAIEVGKEILSNKYLVASNSILVSKLNPRTPRIWMIYGDVISDECICSTEFQIVKPKDIEWLGFIYCFLKSTQVTNELASASSGTSGSHQRVNPQDIFNLSLLRPSNKLVSQFAEITNSYWTKIKLNQKLIKTLMVTRNTLLPKLMNGEARVQMSEL